MISFIAAVYNEEKEIIDLLYHVEPYVDHLFIVDDQSTDSTVDLIRVFRREVTWVNLRALDHTGLPETVKAEALKDVCDGSWVLMLDADERFAPGVLDAIKTFCNSPESEEIDYVYFHQYEVLDSVIVREFQKCKLFRKEAMQFPLNNIHADDVLTGRGLYKDEWAVYHRKSTNKQITREMEYLSTYRKLLDEGKIDEGRYQWLIGLHHFVRPH